MDSCGIISIWNYARYPCMLLDFHRTSWTCTCSCTNPTDSFDSYRLQWNIKDLLKSPHRFRTIPTDSETNLWIRLENIPVVIWNAKLRRPGGWSEIPGYASCLFPCIVIYPTQWSSSGTCLEERRTWQSTVSNIAKTSGQGVQRWLLTRNEPDENIA